MPKKIKVRGGNATASTKVTREAIERKTKSVNYVKRDDRFHGLKRSEIFRELYGKEAKVDSEPPKENETRARAAEEKRLQRAARNAARRR